MFKYSTIFVIVGALLFIGALQQIGVGLYYLGCFRRYNQIVNTVMNWFEDVDLTETVESIRNLILITMAVILIVAVV